MSSPKKALLSAALCMAMTVSSQASSPASYEGTSTNSSTFTSTTTAVAGDLDAITAAKIANANHPLMSLNRGTLTELCQILAENDAADAIANLGQTSIHMAGRILRPVAEYPELFQDELTRIDNPDMRQAIRVDLRKVINAREARIASQTPEENQKKDPFLTPWRDLLGGNASLRNFIWANDMLSPQNVARLKERGLLEQLAKMENKTIALALGAYAAELFTHKMNIGDQEVIIDMVVKAFYSVPKIATRMAVCKQDLFTRDMDGFHQSFILDQVLLLTDAECAKVVRKCQKRLTDDATSRSQFVNKETTQLLMGQRKLFD